MPFTQHQYQELQDELDELGKDFAAMGLDFIIILNGEGISHVAYPAHISTEVPQALESAAKQIRERNCKALN